MEYEIIYIEPKTFLGLNNRLLINQNKIEILWKKFVPLSFNIKNKIGNIFYSFQIYDMEFETAPFTNDLIYTHWACVEINEMNSFEKDLHVLKFNGGKYLKFTHKGLSTDFLKTSYEIYAHWVPFYGFKIENRPHFQIMDERYKSDRIDSEEDLYIPVL